MADRVGFEPTVRSHAHTLSKRAHSTTLTPVRLKSALGRGGRNLSLQYESGNTEMLFLVNLSPFGGVAFLEPCQTPSCRELS